MKDKFEVLNPHFLNNFRLNMTEMKEIQHRGTPQYYPKMLQVSMSLDELFIYEKLKLFCYELSYRSVSNPKRLSHSESEFRFMESIFFELENDESFSNKGIQIFNRLRTAFQQHYENGIAELQEIENIIELIRQSYDILGAEDSIGAYSLVNNLCIKNLNEGRIEYSKPIVRSSCEMINLYDSVSVDYELPTRIYSNLVSVLLISEEVHFGELYLKSMDTRFQSIPTDRFEWIMQFIKCYESNLKKEDSEIYYRYCKAYISYFNGKYEEAHDHLLKLKGQQGVFINLSVKMLHLKVLYDLDVDSEIDTVQHTKELLERYRKLLSYDEQPNRRLLSYQKNYNKIFLKCFNKLRKFRYQYEETPNRSKLKQEKKIQLKEEFEQLPYRFKEWLIVRLEEI